MMFKVLDEACKPTKASKYSSCVDLYAAEDVTIGAGETKVVPLGIKIDLDYLHNNVDVWCGHPYKLARNGMISKEYDKHIEDIHRKNFEWYMTNHCLELKPRSSLPLKKGLIIANGVGEIDLDYKDEIGIILHNSIKHINNVEVYEHQSKNFRPQIRFTDRAEIKKGEKIAQIKLVEHKSYLMGYDSEEERDGGFGSSGGYNES